MSEFRLTEKQAEATRLLGSDAQDILLVGGSRSGKTFTALRAIAMRCLMAPGSRHAVMRYRFNSVVQSIIFDTWPKMLKLCFQGVEPKLNKAHWYVEFANGSQVWFAGLDDKERVEKVLGQEHATILLNECSQIPWESRQIAYTRLAQKVDRVIDGENRGALPVKMYYDENPPDKLHWTYRLFIEKVDPETRAPLPNPNRVAWLLMNPEDNSENLPDGYIEHTLGSMSSRMQGRFRYGQFRDSNPFALFQQEHLDRWRVMDGELVEMARVVVAVDPSGAGEGNNEGNDAIGIVVAGLGTNGIGYLLEDVTMKGGPADWGKAAVAAYDRHEADRIVAEVNFGGAMVKSVIQTARATVPIKEVRASRGKVVRAEPIAALMEKGQIRLVGHFRELEDELSGFNSDGYKGPGSPNRADAMVWAFSDLFPGLIRPKLASTTAPVERMIVNNGWMAA